MQYRPINTPRALGTLRHHLGLLPLRSPEGVVPLSSGGIGCLLHGPGQLHLPKIAVRSTKNPQSTAERPSNLKLGPRASLRTSSFWRSPSKAQRVNTELCTRRQQSLGFPASASNGTCHLVRHNLTRFFFVRDRTAHLQVSLA